jgi:plastocyanin
MRNKTLAAALLAAGLILQSGCGEKTGGRFYRVEIKGMAYAVPELTVAPGDTVVWVNRDIVPHTVTADARQFDSGSMSPSAEWSFVARARGRIPYTCTFHPTMKGVVVVK